MKINSYCKLIDLLKYEYSRHKNDEYEIDGYCIYWEDKTDEYPELTDEIYIGKYPEIDNEDEETFPEEIVKKGWWLCYRDELIQDVIDNAKYQDPNVTYETINKAIDHYNNYDCFMEIKNKD